MNPSLEVCLAEQARQHNLAHNSFLPNVRRVAAAAEKAWEKEAALASKRESRTRTSGSGCDSEPRNSIDVSCEDTVSENPDRGCASQAAPGTTAIGVDRKTSQSVRE